MQPPSAPIAIPIVAELNPSPVPLQPAPNQTSPACQLVFPPDFKFNRPQPHPGLEIIPRPVTQNALDIDWGTWALNR